MRRRLDVVASAGLWALPEPGLIIFVSPADHFLIMLGASVIIFTASLQRVPRTRSTHTSLGAADMRPVAPGKVVGKVVGKVGCSAHLAGTIAHLLLK